MTSLFSKYSFVSGILALGTIAVITPNMVKAATVTYDFNITIDFGPLDGNTYNGILSYDDSLIPGADDSFGYKSIPISNFVFNFEGTDYTESDDTNASVDFLLDGSFLGLNYAGANFSFTGGFFDLSQAYFAYDLGGQTGQGTGQLNYLLRPTASTPEPKTWIGLLALGGVMIVSKLFRR